MTTVRGAMLCPVCHEELKMMDRQGVEIDYCPTCRGVWLDRGELDKVIERTAGLGPAPQESYGSGRDRYRDGAKDYDRDEHEREEYRRRKKRGGFLGDLFDFD